MVCEKPQTGKGIITKEKLQLDSAEDYKSSALRFVLSSCISPIYFSTMEEISIQQVVSEIVASGGDQSTFFIRFVKSSGNEKGHIKTVAKAIYGAPKSKQAATTPQTNKSLHKDKNTLPLTDLERNQYITPLVSHIIQFNKYKVRH